MVNPKFKFFISSWFLMAQIVYLDLSQGMTLNIFKHCLLGYLNLKIYIARLNFNIAIYFNNIKKTEKFQWPCRLQEFKIS